MLVSSFGFTIKERIMAIAVNARKSPPNIERDILKIGSPWRT